MKDGNILQRETLSFPAEALDENPYLRETEAFGITYLGDGLKVKGFLARPRTAGPHPCVIYNRGGGGPSRCSRRSVSRPIT